MNKFYLIDKPLGISSFDIIRNMRRSLGIRKMGHTGTLDPLASGAMLIAVGNYTKLIPFFEKDTKEYEFTINLDGITASFDLGEEISFLSKNLQKEYKKNLDIDKILKILEKKFTGKIIQVPPKYSALKINGQKACDLMRKGQSVEMKNREVEIYKIEILDFKYPELSIRALVSAGTYIRSIASDLGDILGCGGYISKLRRTKIGKLEINKSVKMEDVSESNFLDVSSLFDGTKFITLGDDILKDINDGKIVDFNLNMDSGYYFVKSNNIITNIIYYNENTIKPYKKII